MEKELYPNILHKNKNIYISLHSNVYCKRDNHYITKCIVVNDIISYRVYISDLMRDIWCLPITYRARANLELPNAIYSVLGH